MTIPAHVPADLVVDFDIFDPTLANDFISKLNAMREKTPVAYSPHNGGHWIALRYEDIRTVLTDPTVFSSWPASVPRSIHEQNRMLPIAYDPPEHTAYREIMGPLFSPQRMRALEPQIREHIRSLLDDIAPRGRCDFIADFARPVPMAVFLLLMGWPVEDGPMFTQWSHELLMGKPGGTQEESEAARLEAAMKVSGYFANLISARRAEPQDDITTRIVNARYADERPLTDAELQSMLLLLMLGGLHTVQATMAYTAIHFAKHPEVRARLRANPELLGQSVEEMLRWEAPAWSSRRTVRDVNIGGIEIKSDEMILCALTAGNHDPDQFSAPDEADLARRPNRHLSFGLGPHRCIGSNLARVELTVAFEELHRRIPDYRIDPELPPIRHVGLVTGVEQLGLLYTPTEGSAKP